MVVVEQQLFVDPSTSSDLFDARTGKASPRELLPRGEANT